MTEQLMAVDQARAADIETRLSELAKSKAKLELINRLLVSLSAVAGLDNMVDHILHILMETIGAANISLYYRLDNEWRYRDVYGVTREMAELNNPACLQAIDDGEPLRLQCEQTPYPDSTGKVPTQTWVFPLLSRTRKVGAVVMQEMQLTDDGIFQDLLPFFVYAGMMLDNEINNFSQLAEAHRKLQDSETIYRSLFEQSPDGIQLTDPSTTKPIYFNTAIHRQLGYTYNEYAQLSVKDYEAIEDHEKIASRITTLQESGAITFESIYNTKQGTPLNVYVSLQTITISGQPLILAIVRDISDRKRNEQEQIDLERQLLHTQKLESLGVLAGGIAHDFNNILTAIIGNAELALMRLNPESPVIDNLHRIEKAASRAADLAKQMLAYSGKGKFIVEPIDINRLVEEMGHMLEVSISKKAIFRYNINRPLPSVNADATQLRQIIMNLVINASEAIGNKSGVIAVTTGCLECDGAYLKDVWLTDQIPEGLYVFLEVADTGCGMDKETLTKIFDPFFTTKFTGRGLGMAAVLGIIRGHKGAIKIYSEPGKGTSFKVLLPAGNRPAELFNGSTRNDNWKGSGTALLVDDEETVRAIGCEMLREIGFDVLTASDGREAMEIFKQSRSNISVVILDLTMPHMDGEQCFRELRMIDPNVKVIMSSGFSENEVTQKFAGKGLAGFIQKPYKLSELAGALRSIDPKVQ